MPIDLPPQAPAYHIERATPVQQSSLLSGIAAAARAASARMSLSTQAPAERMLPRIDLKSPSLSAADRVAMVAAMRANLRGDLSEGRVGRPNSYVGDRIALASQFARVKGAATAGAYDAVATRALRCRMVATALDPRAGAYVVGGEPAAAAARRAIPQAALTACAAVARSVVTNAAPARSMISNSAPVASVRFAAAGRIDPSIGARVRVDLPSAARTRIDPVASPKVSVNPVSKRIAAFAFDRASSRAD